MSERIHYKHPLIPNYVVYGTILRSKWYNYILWDADYKWEYLEDFLQAANANDLQYEILQYA